MSRLLLAAIALAAGVATPAAAAPKPKPGDRTVAPEQLLGQVGDAAPDAEIESAAAEAAAHPLGTLANPVRVGGPEGRRSYVARLRCADGSAPKAGQSEPGGVGAYGSVVSLVPLDCGAAAPGRFGLIVDVNHEEHREERAPAGFTLAR
jgi:hypothetical protein